MLSRVMLGKYFCSSAFSVSNLPTVFQYWVLFIFFTLLVSSEQNICFALKLFFLLKICRHRSQFFFPCLFQSRPNVYCKVFSNCCLNVYLYLCVGFKHGLRDQSNMPKIYLMFHQSLGSQYTQKLQNQTDNWEQQMSFTWSLLSLSRTGSRCPQQDKIHN